MEITAIETIEARLSGRYAQVRIAFDLIGRVSSLILIDTSGSEVTIQSEMLDIDERSEVGQILLDGKHNRSNSDLDLVVDFPGRSLSLSDILMVDTDIGPVVGGLALQDKRGTRVTIYCAAEVFSLYATIGSLHSSSEPEFSPEHYYSAQTAH